VPVVASTRIDEEDCMTVIIGIDPHKATHTAVAIDGDERSLGEFEVRAQRNQTQRLLAWAVPFPDRRWAIESADGLGKLLAQQLLAAGEDVVDVPPTLSARVRLSAPYRQGRTTATMPCQPRSRVYGTAGCVQCELTITRPYCDCWSAVTTTSSRCVRKRHVGSTR
jgi:hypothetical protein